jgi:protein-disulfide isomerase
MKNKIFVAGVAVICILGFIILKNNSSPSTKPAVQTGLIENFIRPHSPTFGNSLGRVTVVEWFDPQCESCRMIHPAFKKIISDYKDRVHFVLRYMPYHDGSLYAASALEEAKEFNKFEEALDLIFASQDEWGNHEQPQPELISDYLVKLGIPKARLEKNYLLEKHSEKIRMDEADGKAIGVDGTPTFFVNGQIMSELGDQQLRDAIDGALSD